jgi:hypothetical protein
MSRFVKRRFFYFEPGSISLIGFSGVALFNRKSLLNFY